MIAAGCLFSPTTMKRVMRSLMELSARTVLKSGLDFYDYDRYPQGFYPTLDGSRWYDSTTKRRME